MKNFDNNMDEIKVKITPKDFFLYIATMATLYVSVFSFLALLFGYIDTLLPDKLNYYVIDFSSGTIRFSIASLIIIFPTYLTLTKIFNRDIRKNPEKKNIWIRKWLVYFTLFVSGITIIVELIRIINEFLGGDLTAQFALKVIAVIVVTGLVFGYYAYDLKGKWEREVKKAKIIGWITAFVVLSTIVSGFFIIGSPRTQRLLRFDAEKIQNLENIQWQIVNYWQLKETLPKALSDLEDPISGFVAPRDQQTGEEYSYKIISELAFELCARFNKESVGNAIINDVRVAKSFPIKPVKLGVENSNWSHREGEVCFERTIDPDIFLPKKDR